MVIPLFTPGYTRRFASENPASSNLTTSHEPMIFCGEDEGMGEIERRIKSDTLVGVMSDPEVRARVDILNTVAFKQARELPRRAWLY